MSTYSKDSAAAETLSAQMSDVALQQVLQATDVKNRRGPLQEPLWTAYMQLINDFEDTSCNHAISPCKKSARQRTCRVNLKSYAL
jgi:hypothetical protein